MRRTAWMLGLVVSAGVCGWGQVLQSHVDKDGVYENFGLAVPAKLVHAEQAVIPAGMSVGAKHVCALRVLIGADGTPGVVELVNAHASPFDEAAIAAVKASQFAPGVYEGKPVPTRMMLWVPFLGDGKGAFPVKGSFVAKGLSVPMPLNSVQAEFPKQVPKEFSEAVVVVRLFVTEEGLPSSIWVMRPAGHGFDENALKAVEKYRFTPAKLHGIPVPFEIVVEVNFRRY